MSMIKCPECGHQVSTMAATCPGCGVNIAGHIVQCPQCQGYILDKQDHCPTCGRAVRIVSASQQRVQQSTPQTSASQTTSQAQPQPEQPKKKGSLIIVPVLVGLVALIGLCVGGFLYWNQQNAKEEEERAYEMLMECQDPIIFENYIAKYPNSTHIAEVRARLEQVNAEGREWQQICERGSRREFLTFKEKYPKSIYLPACMDKLDSLDWQDALKAENDEAIDRYLAAHPNGLYISEAAEKKNELARTKVSPEEKQQLRSLFDQFFTAVGKGDAASISSMIPTQMEQFIGTKSATANDIVAWVDKKNAADVIGIHYLVGAELGVHKESVDGKLVTCVTFNLDETINRSDASQPASATYHVTARVDESHKITTLTLTTK